MKVDFERPSISGDFAGKSYAFGIGDPDIIISILRDKLYSDKKRVVVQEYISNARDANREVGAPDHKIDITMPCWADQTFSVRDYGPGLSPDRVANVFVKFGASTKRHTNSMTGGFGIGAKSAWAYTESFFVTSFYNGTKYQYLCHVSERASGEMTLVNESPTDEPNGVLVSVPVKQPDIYDFNKKILMTVFTWDERPNLICNDLNVTAMIADWFRSKNYTLANTENGVEYKFTIFDIYGVNSNLISIDGICYPYSTLDRINPFTETHYYFNGNNQALILHEYRGKANGPPPNDLPQSSLQAILDTIN